jgi:hypothetical protein
VVGSNAVRRCRRIVALTQTRIRRATPTVAMIVRPIGRCVWAVAILAGPLCAYVTRMHTMSMHARQVTRWRWLATALLVILLQAVAALVVRAGDSRDSTTRSPAGETHDGRGTSPGRGVVAAVS